MNKETFLGVEVSLDSTDQDENEVRSRHEANREAWNEGATYYRKGNDEAIAFLKAGNSNVHPLERANLVASQGEFKRWCKLAIHLQCASGQDTLSLLNEGVHEVVGIDISDVHIGNARLRSEALGAAARWYRCDVLDAPDELNDAADLVYTGRGALCWLHDLTAWGQVVARLLKPGGVVHILDDHPLTWLFNQNAEEYRATGFDYFKHSEVSQGWPDTYIGTLGKPVEEEAKKYERIWPLSSVFSALTGAGLQVEHLGEHPDEYWNGFPYLKPELRGRIPMTFTLLARKPHS